MSCPILLMDDIFTYPQMKPIEEKQKEQEKKKKKPSGLVGQRHGMKCPVKSSEVK